MSFADFYGQMNTGAIVIHRCVFVQRAYIANVTKSIRISMFFLYYVRCTLYGLSHSTLHYLFVRCSLYLFTECTMNDNSSKNVPETYTRTSYTSVRIPYNLFDILDLKKQNEQKREQFHSHIFYHYQIYCLVLA